MSITTKDKNLYLIMEQLGKFVPDDIKYKILLLLLGIGRECNQFISVEFISQRQKMLRCGYHYEINMPAGTVQYAIMCEMRIAKFDAERNNGRKKALGAITTINKYMKKLDARFKQRYKLLF
jgi:hypothetical protein